MPLISCIGLETVEQVPGFNDLSAAPAGSELDSPPVSQSHLQHAPVVTVSFLGLIRSGTGLAVLMIYFYREYNLLAEMMYNCKLPRAMLRTVLVFGLLSDSVNKGSVLYWVFVANIVLSVLSAPKCNQIIHNHPT